MKFRWTYQVPETNWWANYRWHLTEPSEKLGLKSSGWKKSFFRKGWQGKLLQIENTDNAKKCLQSLQNGTITVFGGRFRGASYDKNAERIIKQAKRSLKVAIKKHEKEEINIQEIAVIPSSYYHWGKILVIVLISSFIIATILFLFLRKKKR